MMGIGIGQARRLRAGLAGSLLLALGMLSGCEPPPAPHGAKKPKVVVTTPITDRVMDYQDFTGRLEADRTVDIRARVNGYLTASPFKEGDLVKEGDLLAQIDPRPYRATLNQKEATLKLALADRNYQTHNADRFERLLQTKAASIDEYQKVLADRDKAVAQVGAAEADRDKAKLDLEFTRVVAPISGRISRRAVDPGNVVIADNTLLTTIVTEDPMCGYFDVDERTYQDLLNHIAPGKATSWFKGLKFPVLMRLATDKEFERVGYVDFVDNRIIATSGTVKMRGVFKNDNLFLKAGMFMRVRLPLGASYDAIIIPDEAVQSDQERKYVWVVNQDNEVEYRSVKLGPAIGDLRVIRPPEPGMEGKEGLKPGERIVISGMQRVRKGVQVETENQPPPAPPHMPLVRLLAEHQAAQRGGSVVPAGGAQ